MNFERLKSKLIQKSRAHNAKRAVHTCINNDAQLQLATGMVTPSNSRTDHSSDLLKDWTVKYKETILNAVINHRNAGGFTCNQLKPQPI